MRVCWIFIPFFLVLFLFSGVQSADSPAPLTSDFFESKIRPVLVDHCYSCHNSTQSTEGGLALDHRAGLLRGGDSGAVIVPGKPKNSRLIAILKHQIEGVKMPQGQAKLDEKSIGDFEKWILMGAPDPRDKPPSQEELIKATSWEAIFAKRKTHWSFQPVKNPPLPRTQDKAWSDHPVDRFILAKLEQQGLNPAAQADKKALLRRLTLDLTGLPPEPAELLHFLADTSPKAYETVVDRLLASPRFGEHWARHWMDLVRYSESHGSQGDPNLPMVWRYRDYLIRALNSDVPYNLFLKEHLAGDLIANPRLNKEENLNESILGTAHLRMTELGYIPVDALEDQVKVIDNQIDVLSKTFMGLTVSCARCHDHKFDPISQKDFYALYGVFASCRPGQVVVDTPEVLAKNRNELTAMKTMIRGKLADAWLYEARNIGTILQKAVEKEKVVERLEGQRKQLRQKIATLENSARKTLLQNRGKQLSQGLHSPHAKWTFEGDALDSVGECHGQLQGGAIIRNGRLILDGIGANLQTAVLDRDMGERTLEAWVSLSHLNQRGGGVIGIESTEGGRFDSIVFGEMEPKRWLAGSDFFRRSQSPAGTDETAGAGELVHMAIVYKKDGQITIYRNGERYGVTYKKAPLQEYTKGLSRFVFGHRHIGANPPLAGEIEEARAYAKALSDVEIKASFQAGFEEIKPEELARVFTPAERIEHRKGKAELLEIDTNLKKTKSESSGTDLWFEALKGAKTDRHSSLHPWTVLHSVDAPEIAKVSRKMEQEKAKEDNEATAFNKKHSIFQWDIVGANASQWFKSGTGLPILPIPEGDFSVETAGDILLKEIYPKGFHTHSLSKKHTGILTSPRFKIETNNISIRAMGENSVARVVIENYPIGNGGIYPATRLDADEMGWLRLDTTYRRGSHAYVEIVTGGDYPTGVPGSAKRPTNVNQAYFSAEKVVFHNEPGLPKEHYPALNYFFEGFVPKSTEELAHHYATKLESAVVAWKMGTIDGGQAAFLNDFVKKGLLSNSLSKLPQLRPLVVDYRRLEEQISVPRRAPGVHETEAFNQPLFVRGQHQKPGQPVERSAPSLFGGHPFRTTQSGRLELAMQLASTENPLTQRVMVNRLWHHLFGKGIVETVDNFGLLGTKPTHPELLDYLAFRFVNEGWSIKKMIKLLVTSKAYCQKAIASPEAKQKDPANNYLSHMNIRRLEAEAIRDGILAISGQASYKMYGPGVEVYFVGKTEGGGAKGPLDGDGRRSVYQRIKRNSHNPFLEAFDAPKPATTRGDRDTTNVPAQSLTLLNDPFVIDQASKWAKVLMADPMTSTQRIRKAFMRALTREPSEFEIQQSLNYLAELAVEYKLSPLDLPNHEKIWQDFVHSLFCLKEFIYVH